MPVSSNDFLSSSRVARSPRLGIEPGEPLGRFVVVRHLGSGAFGDVYLAQDTLGDREVAVKAVDVGPCGAAAAAAELKREVTAYSRIRDHRHVLKVYDMHQVPYGGTQLLLLSMEYADGGNLRDWLIAHRDDVDARRTEGLAYFRQAALGLSACQEAGVLCFDVKPENIIFVDGVAKVGDLGGAWVVADTSPRQMPAAAADTAEIRPGTPQYASPDSQRARHPGELDFRTVIYALGVMLYEILHPGGLLPFQGSDHQLREQHQYDPPPPLPGASETEARVFQRCLDKDPARRYASVQELLDDLGDDAVANVDETEGDAGDDETEAEWQRACAAAEDGCFGDAELLCCSVLHGCPRHAEARELLAELRRRYSQAQQIYAAIERESDTSGLAELSALLTEAVDAYPDHPAGIPVQIRLDLRAQRYRQAMADVVAAIQGGNWEAALSNLDVARRLNPGAREVEELARFVAGVRGHVEGERRRIDAAAAEDDREKAEALAENLERYLAQMAGVVSASEGGEGT